MIFQRFEFFMSFGAPLFNGLVLRVSIFRARVYHHPKGVHHVFNGGSDFQGNIFSHT